MFRTLTRATHSASRTSTHDVPIILPSASAPPITPLTSPSSTTSAAKLRASRVAYFLECPSVGPVTANRLVAHGCHTYRDAVNRDGVPGSGEELTVRQHYHLHEEAWFDEWVEKKQRMAEREAW